MSTDPRFGGLYSISTSQGALADSAPIRQHRRSIATIKALQESASEGSLYPSVAVKPELAQDWQANVSQQDGFHSASVLREPVGMLTPYVENELTRSIKNMGRQHGMNGRRASEAPPSADGDAPTKVLMRTQLLPSAVVRDLWRTSKKPLSNEIVKARAAAEAPRPRRAAAVRHAVAPRVRSRGALRRGPPRSRRHGLRRRRRPRPRASRSPKAPRSRNSLASNRRRSMVRSLRSQVKW